MPSEENKEQTPAGEQNGTEASSGAQPVEQPVTPEGAASEVDTPEASYGYEDTYGNPYGDPYADPYASPAAAVTEEPPVPAPAAAEPPPPSPPKDESSEDEDEDDDGMLRMSFLEHLEELRLRLIYALGGLGVSFLLCMTFSERLWAIVQQPASIALRDLGYKDAALVFTSPMESFLIIWFKLPLLVSLFIASPWVLYQVWAFVAPGLYKRERRWAVPFILTSAGLFIAGGLFAYFIAFRFGLTFLLGVGQNVGVRPMVTISEYFDIFVNVILGVGIVFELPVLIFFLTLLRITTPGFLIRHSRYAVLAIVVLAAVITPTPDVFNLMLFSVPMVILYFVGIFASYILVLSRENKRFPWAATLIVIGVLALVAAFGVYLAVSRFGYRIVGEWPYLLR